MKNKWMLPFVFVLVFTGRAYTQDDEALEKIRAAKVAFFTNKLSLSTAEAQAFWPIFNEYEEKHHQLKKKKRSLMMSRFIEEKSDNELIADLRKLHELRHNEVELDKEYLEKYLKVLPPQKVADYYRAERQFSIEVLKNMRRNMDGKHRRRGPHHKDDGGE
jgi:hypothetical protein